jgi:hypothetical protein
MKKTLLSLALLAGITSAAQAQTGLKLGLKGGFNGSTFSGSDSKGSEYKAGFAAGGLINYGFSDLISVQGELLYSQKGASIDNYDKNSSGSGFVQNTTFKSTLGYLDVPILLKVTTGDAGKGLFFELGPQGSFVLHNRDFFQNGNDQTTANTSTDALNKVVIGYAAGIGYQITSGFGLGIRYTGDISQVYKDNGTILLTAPGIALNVPSPNVHNSVFQFQVHYLFGGE